MHDMIPNILPNPLNKKAVEVLLPYFSDPPDRRTEAHMVADTIADGLLDYEKSKQEMLAELTLELATLKLKQESLENSETAITAMGAAQHLLDDIDKELHGHTFKSVFSSRSNPTVTTEVWEPGPNAEQNMDEDDKAIAALLSSSDENEVTTPVIDQVTQTDTYIQDIKYQLAKFTSRMLRALNSQAPFSE